MEKRIPLILAVLGILSLTIIFSQNAFAQSSATVQLFQTGLVSDDECTAIAQTGSITWLGCFPTGSSNLRINAMSGNTTITTLTLNTQIEGGIKFFPVTSNTIVLVDTSGVDEVVRKYELSGSTITNTQSLTLTGCAADVYRPNVVGTSLFYLCANGDIKVIGLNTMILENTLTTLIQGDCANPQGIFMASGVKGIVFCDNTEAYLFTVSGSTISFSDSLTGWDSITQFRWIKFTGQTGDFFTIWTGDQQGTTIQVATVDFNALTFSSGITTVPSQADVTEALALGIHMFTIDATDENMLSYDWRKEQPSIAEANFSGGGLLIDVNPGFAIASDNISLLIASSVLDTGRYYIISDIIINGDPVGEEPVDDDPFDTGIDCSLPANEHKLICNIPGGGGIETNLGNATGGELLLITCTVVFVVCEDTDPRTNGIGLLAFVASLFVIIGMFYYVLGTDRTANIPLFVWITIVLALSAFFTLAGWIDPVFLIISMVVVIALAAPTIINKFGGKGGTTFGGGSTE